MNPTGTDSPVKTTAPRKRHAMAFVVDACLSPSTVLSLALVSFCLIGCAGPRTTSRPPGFNLDSLNTTPVSAPAPAPTKSAEPAPVNHGVDIDDSEPLEIAVPASVETEPVAEIPAIIEPAATRDRSSEAVSEAVALFESGAVAEAGVLLSRVILSDDTDAALEAQIWPLMRLIRKQTHFAEPGTDGLPVYTVEKGDTLSEIGKKVGVAWERIALANKLASADRVRPGQRLRVRNESLRLIVRIEHCDVLIVCGDAVIERFSVGIGSATTPTPRGHYRIATRIEKPAHEGIKGGDATNPLGAYWLGLVAAADKSGTKTGYGIHGTIDNDSIGNATSEGCVRMRDEDVTTLAGWTEIGTSVEIR
jgi:LysM repeat protein